MKPDRDIRDTTLPDAAERETGNSQTTCCPQFSSPHSTSPSCSCFSHHSGTPEDAAFRIFPKDFLPLSYSSSSSSPSSASSSVFSSSSSASASSSPTPVPSPYTCSTPATGCRMRAGVSATSGVIVLSLIKLSLWADVIFLLRGVGSEDTSAGFTATKVPGLNLISVQCNGSHLPADARSIQNMVLFHYPTQTGSQSYTIASLSSVDGVVRLENPKILENGFATSTSVEGGVVLKRRIKSDIYVGGRFVMDDAKQTCLSVLLGPSGYGNYKDLDSEVLVKFECEIGYTTKNGRTGITKRFLNVSFADLDSSYQVHPLHSVDHSRTGETSKEGERGVRASSSSASRVRKTTSGALLDTPMILLITMAILLFFLFIICVLLIVDRYQGNRRQRQRCAKSNRKRGGASGTVEGGVRESTSMGGGISIEKGEGQENRPLPPPPPSWNYPQVMGAPAPKSPYNRLRVNSEGNYLRDDTGYDSDASMHYSRPFDELGGTTQEKPHLQTFGKHLPPLYATSPSFGK